MSEVKWTKGGWSVSERQLVVMRSDRRIIAALRIHDLEPATIKRAVADAHLIAAAPELYEALAEMLSLWEGFSKDELKRRHLLGFIDTPALERIFAGRAALAKARGEGTAP